MLYPNLQNLTFLHELLHIDFTTDLHSVLHQYDKFYLLFIAFFSLLHCVNMYDFARFRRFISPPSPVCKMSFCVYMRHNEESRGRMRLSTAFVPTKTVDRESCTAEPFKGPEVLTKLHQQAVLPTGHLSYLASTWMVDPREYRLAVDLLVQSRTCKQITNPIILQM
jgi:hypothetical protein